MCDTTYTDIGTKHNTYTAHSWLAYMKDIHVKSQLMVQVAMADNNNIMGWMYMYTHTHSLQSMVVCM